MKIIKSLLCTLFLGGCAYCLPDGNVVVPYSNYSYSPPRAWSAPVTYYNGYNVSSVRTVEPVYLRQVDNSNVRVYSNGDWWWGGSGRGWIPTGGGWYPQPGQVYSSRNRCR